MSVSFLYYCCQNRFFFHQDVKILKILRPKTEYNKKRKRSEEVVGKSKKSKNNAGNALARFGAMNDLAKNCHDAISEDDEFEVSFRMRTF